MTTQDVIFSRVHIKMLSGDYLCSYYKHRDRGTGSRCQLCFILCGNINPPDETMCHLLTRCRGTVEIRTNIITELLNTISHRIPYNGLLQQTNHDHLTQFILDPTSLNLPMNIRVPPDDWALPDILRICRKLCYSVHKERTRLLKDNM